MYGHSYLVTRFLSDGTIELSRIKIGYFSGNDLENQIHQSYARSLTPVTIYDYIPSHNPKWAETTIHIALNRWRINPKNEIFDLSSQEARDTFIEVKNFIVHLTKISGLPVPMKRKINYTYWTIARQAARKGRKWATKYLEKQILENKKQEKNERKKEIEKKKKENDIRKKKIELNKKEANRIKQERSKKPKNKKERRESELFDKMMGWKTKNLIYVNSNDKILYEDVHENYKKFFNEDISPSKFTRNLNKIDINVVRSNHIKWIYGYKII